MDRAASCRRYAAPHFGRKWPKATLRDYQLLHCKRSFDRLVGAHMKRWGALIISAANPSSLRPRSSVLHRTSVRRLFRSPRSYTADDHKRDQNGNKDCKSVRIHTRTQLPLSRWPSSLNLRSPLQSAASAWSGPSTSQKPRSHAAPCRGHIGLLVGAPQSLQLRQRPASR
jgi:hypothetical protein